MSAPSGKPPLPFAAATAAAAGLLFVAFTWGSSLLHYTFPAAKYQSERRSEQVEEEAPDGGMGNLRRGREDRVERALLGEVTQELTVSS